MESVTLYLALEQSTMVNARKVHIGDIASLFCVNPDISHQVSKTEILVMHNTAQDQVVISVMKLIELINTQFKDLNIVSIGSPETIVYYKNLPSEKTMTSKIKTIFLMLIAFLGTAYSIMAYNSDVETSKLLQELHRLFTGQEATSGDTGMLLGIILYSIGLCIGMIVFFNHGFNKNSINDPTPLQVQMRLYEQDINQAIIIDSSRKNKTIDVD